MKAKLLPLTFSNGDEQALKAQMNALHDSLGHVADFESLSPINNFSVSDDIDAIVFPELTGEIYSSYQYLNKLNVPILVITSEYITMAMWDWEIAGYLKERGYEVFTPYSLRQAEVICKSLALKREMTRANFLVYQDTPGDGQQASIFKRFFWWEQECIDNIKEKFGVSVIKKSFKAFSEQAEAIPDDTTREEWKKWDRKVEVSEKSLLDAVRVYIQSKKEMAMHDNVVGIGSNCLNESFYSNTTPCLAWDMIFEESDVVWACEADITLMMTSYLLNGVLGKPFMMTNIYPFLMGEAACKHEKIEAFPDIPNAENHALCAHCGYFGIVANKHATRYSVKPKILDIVDDNAIALDAELPTGNALILKLGPDMSKLYVSETNLKEYMKFPGSHALNAALLELEDGHSIMNNLPSHHVVILRDTTMQEVEIISRIFGLELINI